LGKNPPIFWISQNWKGKRKPHLFGRAGTEGRNNMGVRFLIVLDNPLRHTSSSIRMTEEEEEEEEVT
jgi:hypothetical protein